MSPSLVRYIMERTCLRKKNLNKEKANRVIHIFARQGELVYYYKCHFCNSFHVTSSPPDKEHENPVVVI